MPPVPVLGIRDIIKALNRAGFQISGQSGSHIKFKRGSRTVVVPHHNPVKRGTLREVIRESGMTVADSSNC